MTVRGWAILAGVLGASLVAFSVWPVQEPAEQAQKPVEPQRKKKREPKPVPVEQRRPGAQIPTHAVDGKAVDWRGAREKSAIVAFFSPRQQDLMDTLKAYQAIHTERKQGNIELIAASIDPGSGPGLRALAEENGFQYPIVVDDGGAMQEAYKVKAIPHVFFFSEGGKFIGEIPGFPEAGSPTPLVFYTNLLRRASGLDQKVKGDPSAVPFPALPDFEIAGTGVSKASLKGKSFVLAFVAADCDKCRAQLQFYRTLHQEFAPHGLEFVVVLVSDDKSPEKFKEERQLPFPVYGDRGGDLRHGLHYRGFVPDTLLVDGEGRIRYRHVTFDDEQPPLYQMELRRMLGLANPPILKRNGFSGVRRCMVCHEREYFDWTATSHAHAMRTLKAIGEATKAECVKCHVVGWDEPGGYNADRGARAEVLGDVQCESCHNAGGPHLPDAVRGPVTASKCAKCHDAKHSLNFDFDKFKPLIDHSTDVLSVTPEQRAKIVAQREAARRALLEPDGAYVGAQACASCHEAQTASWKSSAHARALDRLDAASRDKQACLRCHTTGLDRRWEPAIAKGGDRKRDASVQCESCHGPGQAHTVAKDPETWRQTIIGLGERCPECVIRQICTGCHDQKNDPDFELKTALEKIRPLCRPTTR